MLLVVVDQARVGRRRDDPVERAGQVEVAGIAVQHLGLAPARAHARELSDPRERVERVAAQEVLGALDRAADLLVLVAPVLADLRLAREVEVEVRRPACRASRPREHDAQDVGVLVLVDEGAEERELCCGAGGEPLGEVAGRAAAAGSPRRSSGAAASRAARARA